MDKRTNKQSEEHIQKRIATIKKNNFYAVDIDKEECIKLYGEGQTTRQLAKKYGFKRHKSITERLKKWGVKLRPAYALTMSDYVRKKTLEGIKRAWKEHYDEMRLRCAGHMIGRTGEKHHGWKGGITREWARKVAGEHYEMICQDCGAIDKELLVHHKDENVENNELGNLKILCLSCHAKEHGRGTKEWLEEHKR
jgi:hypothetical protein